MSDAEEPLAVLLPGAAPGVRRVCCTLSDAAAPALTLTLETEYVPARNDCVLGVVAAKSQDAVFLDIRAHANARLPYTNFRNASKQHRPQLEIGDLVFCAVLDCEPRGDIECTCICAFDAKSWDTKECYFGKVEDALSFELSLAQARVLTEPDCALLYLIGLHLPFEIWVGANGLGCVAAQSLKLALRIREIVQRGLACESFTALESYVNCELKRLGYSPA